MATDTYPRRLAYASGIIEARDMAPGDVIMRRAHGDVDLTPHTIAHVSHIRGDIVVSYTDGGASYLSPRMTAALA